MSPSSTGHGGHFFFFASHSRVVGDLDVIHLTTPLPPAGRVVFVSVVGVVRVICVTVPEMHTCIPFKSSQIT